MVSNFETGLNMFKKIILVIMLIAGFVSFASLLSLYIQIQLTKFGFCPIPIFIIIPSIASVGIFIGSFVYYVMIGKIEKSREKKIEGISCVLDMLPLNEREIIKKIVENNGKITQSKLSSYFGKVKTFRTIENLRKRGIVEKKRYGKTNIIELNEKYLKILV